MEPLIPDPTGHEAIPEVAKEVEALVAQIDSVSTLEAIQARESTTMPVEEEILKIRPTSHWGLNE